MGTSFAIDPSLLEFRHLRYFVGVVDNGSFRGAAVRLGVSQPPLTRQVHQLEELLGVELLVRTSRGVVPTEAGAVFYAEARNLLGLSDAAMHRAHLTGTGRLGRLDVGVFGSSVFDAVPQIIHTFRDRYPGAEVAVHNLDRPAQMRALRDRRLTVGFNRYFGEEEGLRWEVIQTEHLHVALHHTHPLAAQAELRLAEIAREPLILYPRKPRPGFIDHVLRRLHAERATPHAVTEVDDVITAVSLVSGGLGVSLVTDSGCNLRLPSVVYRPLHARSQLTVDLSVIYRDDDEAPLLRAFLEVARALPHAGESVPRPRRAGNAGRRG